MEDLNNVYREEVIPPPPVPALKPGWFTTEFFVTITIHLCAIAVLIGFITSDTADAVVKAVGQLVPLVIQAITGGWYAKVRGDTKQATSSAQETYYKAFGPQG